MNTILITGSAGFIGYHVSKRLLSEGMQVIGIDNLNSYYSPELKKERNSQLLTHSNYKFYKGDISDESLLIKIGGENIIDKIGHFAAQAGVRYSIENPYIYETTNSGGFLHILELARRHSIKDVVYASSSSVYGNTTMPATGFLESLPVNEPISIYGMTKRANELTAYTYHHLYGLNMTGLRFFTVYGPWGRPDMAYYKFVDAIENNKTINVFNKGKMKRDFTYITDIVKGVVAALNKPMPYEIFNLGNSQTVYLDYFIECIENTLGKKAGKIFLDAQPGDLLETYANISHAQEVLNFSPSVSIEQGIEEFVNWYRSYMASK